MTAEPRPATAPVEPVVLAAAVARAVTALSDVVDLDDGHVGEIATYWRGRRVGGVRLRAGSPPRIAVHVIVRYGRPLPEVAADVRALACAAAAELDDNLARAAVDVHITDLAVEDEP